MVPEFRYTTLTESGDDERLGAILTQCFISPPGLENTYLRRIGHDNFRTIYHYHTLAGGLALIPMGQWWGGRCVPMVGIASVGIAPEHRGSGAAGIMMQRTIAELHEREVPISVLYPAVQRLYRSVGYEQAGTYCRWTVDARTLPFKPLPLPVEPLSFSDLEEFQTLQQQQGRSRNGHLDRHPALWTELMQADKPISERGGFYAYRLGSGTDPQGYLLFNQTRTPGGTVLQVKDWVALSPEAIATVWAFLASHRSQIDTIQWQSSPLDDLACGLPEQEAEVKSILRWMLRIVSVQPALAQRGYPPTVQGNLHLQIRDSLVPGNDGRFVLSVDQGQGQVSRGGEGTVQLSIAALASLYSGFLSPAQLRWMGQLQAPDEAIALATQCFMGESPWMPDFF